MLRVVTFVRFCAGLDAEQAFRRWQTHTDTWDRRDHPEIVRTRLVRFDAGGGLGYDGFAETVWPSREAFDQAAAWYQEPASATHYADLCEFLDMDGSQTVVIEEDCVLDGNPR
ncbi:MAG TPA: hypothetical protein VL027_14215 [Spongiibacteraceae bacterium]|jgi:hypothetical protein|nr:hypothetical protein [Spongiibacteraceae bacterium]